MADMLTVLLETGIAVSDPLPEPADSPSVFERLAVGWPDWAPLPPIPNLALAITAARFCRSGAARAVSRSLPSRRNRR